MENSKPRNLNRKQVVSNPSTSSSTSFSFHQTPPTPFHDQLVEYDPAEAEWIYGQLSSLPPGFRFMPTDTELILDYLRPKIANQKLPLCLIHPVNIYRYHPKTLEGRYLKHPHGKEVFYFSPRDRKYINGERPNRTVVGFGFWKANGTDANVMLGGEIIGYKKTLVFYEGKHPGKKTNWIMHEFRTCESRKRTSNQDMKLDDWVLCRIREKEETGHSRNKNKKNKEANVNSNISDTDAENDLIDPVDVKDDNSIPDYDEEDNYLNANDHGSTSYHNQVTDYNKENHHLNANYGSTSYHNQVTDYNEEDRRLNATYDCTYQNELYQSHQNMGLPPLPQSSPYLFDTCQGNFDMINELISVPGPSNELVTDGLDFNGLWASSIICDNSFDTFCVDPDNFQGNSTGLNIKDVDDEKQTKLPEN